MSQPEPDASVLSRKVRGPKMRLAGFPAMDPLCNTFASISATRARAELRPGIDVSVYGFEVVRHGDYLRQLRAPSAIYLLSFDAQQGAGLIKAHPRLLGKVLDIFLGGDGSFEESNFARALTGIDLSIYGKFVELMGRAFDEAIHELCGRSAIGMPSPTRFEEQPGMVRIAPDRAELFVIKLNFHVAEDKRGAGLDFAIPVSTLEPLKKDLLSTENPNDPMRLVWAENIKNQVLCLPLKMEGVVELGGFTVGELSRLRQGQLLELPYDALSKISLRVPTRSGPHRVARAKLGAVDRHKALRLLEDPDRPFLEPMIRLAEGEE